VAVINIKNCNSVSEANIIIDDGKLNIKYGINGTGKSTIAKAIKFYNNLENLRDLLPFKYRENNPDKIKPAVGGAECYPDIMIFNEEYIEQFVFKQDELLENSFEIFIKDDRYQENLDAIEELFSDVKNLFKTNDTLAKVIEDLGELSSSFSSTGGGMAKNGQMYKALSGGNKIENIPTGLEEYSDYLKSDKNTAWIRWQISGGGFMEISNKCPFCTSAIETRKETIKRVATEYPNDKTIEYLLKIIKVMDSLKGYFTIETQATIEKITKNKIGIDDAENDFLKRIKSEIDTLIKKLDNLQHLAYFSFNNVDNMATELDRLKIDLKLVPALNSSTTQAVIEPLNTLLKDLINKTGMLKGKINTQKQTIARKIDSHKKEINDFLKFAGYKYAIEIEEYEQEYKLKLRHNDLSTSVQKGSQHLSFGEKNAFALMLFMYDCLSKAPDLIIMDDPISSFDKNKKFAIMERLFRGEKSFKEKTVLMLTHDIDPIIDVFKVLYGKLEPVPVASFLKSRNGIIEEIEIAKNDLLTFAQVCKENILSSSEVINKLIYLRRYYEVLDDKSEAYHLLANLFHAREVPSIGTLEMTSEEISKASDTIREHIPMFNYNEQLARIKDENVLKEIYNNCQSDYEKLQLFRMINVGRHPSDVIQKYINETYHIENEYISQLNPRKYEVIPEFIIEECNKAMLIL
jgi:energy-coupling factor transporter ATP-binding protein EcfA2